MSHTVKVNALRAVVSAASVVGAPVLAAKVVAVLMAAALMVVTAGCGTEPAGKDDPIPDGFDVPAGVTISEGGTTRTIGESASVVYQISDQTRSAITVTVDKIQEGEIGDFKFFSLDDAAKAATPYYVSATLRNEGPAGLGGAAVPLYAHDSSNAITPPTDIVGDFAPCQNRTLPDSLLPGESAKVCLVYLVPEGTTLVSVDVKTADMDEPISWQP